MKCITVLLADDHTVVRNGFRKLLDAEDDLEVIGEAQNGRQAVELTRKLRPAVVVMDIAMPLLNGLEATRQILKAFPEIKVVILSAHSDDAYIDQAVAIGAVGFLLKQTSSHDLSAAIREVQKGNTFFSPSISARLHDQKVSARGGSVWDTTSGTMRCSPHVGLRKLLWRVERPLHQNNRTLYPTRQCSAELRFEPRLSNYF